MIDRVSLSRLVNQALETESRVKRKDPSPESERKEDIVEISEVAKRAFLSAKVERIRNEIAKGTYEVNTDKIIEGLRKFLD